MHHDVISDFNILGGLPKGAARQALSEEIAGEGSKVLDKDKIILSNGDVVAYLPPPEKLCMPDLSNVKSIRHYFGQKGYRVYPAWLYHPNRDAVLVRDHKEAADYGIVYRETTQDERSRFGVRHVWDWEEGCQWRPNPWTEAKFDPKNPGAGKTVVYSAPDPKIAQHELVSALIPAVAAAVAQSLKATGPAAPASVDRQEWDEFLAFKAWQKAQEVVSGAAAAIVQDANATTDVLWTEDQPPADDLLANALSPEQDRVVWEAEAKRLGIEVDGRWSIKRLKAEVNKASGQAS